MTFSTGCTALARSSLLAALVAVLFVTGCGHKHTARPPAPQATAPAESGTQTGRIPITPIPHGGVSEEDIEFVRSHRPVYSEMGLATWYTAPYKGRRAANGQVFDDDALTAAHRTLPMGSLIVVTNLATNHSSPMRIADRGPFVRDKVIDLTKASAKAVGVYWAGVAKVRIDVYQTPKPIDTGGRWCVQFGAFHSEHKAIKLKSELLKRYPGAKVIEFPGQDSYWVRIRPEGDNRELAEEIARRNHPAEGDAYLTRMD